MGTDYYDDVKIMTCECGCNTLIQSKMRNSQSFRRGEREYYCPNCEKISFGDNTAVFRYVRADSLHDIHRLAGQQYVQTQLDEKDAEIANLRKRIEKLEAKETARWTAMLSD